MIKAIYEKPTLEKAQEMVFMFEVFKADTGSGNKVSCRQCSGCHGCR